MLLGSVVSCPNTERHFFCSGIYQCPIHNANVDMNNSDQHGPYILLEYPFYLSFSNTISIYLMNTNLPAVYFHSILVVFPYFSLGLYFWCHGLFQWSPETIAFARPSVRTIIYSLIDANPTHRFVQSTLGLSYHHHSSAMITFNRVPIFTCSHGALIFNLSSFESQLLKEAKQCFRYTDKWCSSWWNSESDV